jgi:resuscitation-promoting factor RpfB
MGNAALLVTLLAVASLYLVLEKNVTLVLNGHPQAVRTTSDNVGQLLHARGIVLNRKDYVAPPPGTPLTDGMTVVVDTHWSSRTPSGVGVWVVEGVAGTSAKPPGLGNEDGFSAGEPVGPSRVVDARVVVNGKAHDVLTNATTVRDLLSAMGIEPDGTDRVLPPPSAPLTSGETVRYVDVELRTNQVVIPIPFQTMSAFSSSLGAGTVRVTQPGTPGRMSVTYLVKVADGRIVGRTVVARRVIQRPVPERRLVGRVGSPVHGSQTGNASWYTFAPGSGFTAAHPWLPYGTIVTVTDLATGKSIQVVINDRGPFAPGRIIDLSSEAFAALAPLGEGLMAVRLSW